LKKRLDITLVERGFFKSREKAKASIMAGLVYVDGQMLDKAGMQVKEDAEIEIRSTCPYVGRGGLKLEKALSLFDIDLNASVCVDMGASTGGFTDCMLQKGAQKVFSIDVGYGQLDYKLRNDSRVINLEKTNIRYMDRDIITPKADFISIDVSFISLFHIFPVAAEVSNDNADIIALVKPQFEAGREQVGKKGVIRDPLVHKEVLQKVDAFAEDNGLHMNALTYSPIKGAKGNIEYLLHMKKTEGPDNASRLQIIEAVVSEAHHSL
jgi:23S rRNA (cytidine1920-2'-O)/16S rRNA (cytidine1409-2'-O)-methyltransferase